MANNQNHSILIDKAEENFKAAGLCAQNKYFNASSNRIWYCFYLLMVEYLSSSGVSIGDVNSANEKYKKYYSHTGIKRYFYEFVLPGICKEEKLRRELTKAIEKSFILRGKADYKNFPVTEKEYSEKMNLFENTYYYFKEAACRINSKKISKK